MNERIKELSAQATEYATARHPVSGIVLTVDKDKFEQKFAELVAQECANYCSEYATRILKFSQFGSNAAADCANLIKEHFGIK